MENNEHCKLCEKIVVTLEMSEPVDSLFELPNTYSRAAGKYEWRFHDVMAYALIPRAIENRTAHIDMYLCIDEDDLDDIDVRGYAQRFLCDGILTQWKKFKNLHLLEPVLSSPEVVECRKSRLYTGVHDE